MQCFVPLSNVAVVFPRIVNHIFAVFPVFRLPFVEFSSVSLADDTSTYYSDQCPARLELSINTDISTLDLWFHNNFLTVNAGKTQAMVMGKSDFDYDIKVADTSIQMGTSSKF